MIIKVLMYVGFSGYQYTSIIKLDNNLVQLKKKILNILRCRISHFIHFAWYFLGEELRLR